jgi:hypothetical protein
MVGSFAPNERAIFELSDLMYMSDHNSMITRIHDVADRAGEKRTCVAHNRNLPPPELPFHPGETLILLSTGKPVG